MCNNYYQFGIINVADDFCLIISHIHGGGIVNSSAPSPHIRLRILGKRGNDVTDVKLGQELIIKVEIDENSKCKRKPRIVMEHAEIGDILNIF